MMKTAYDHWVDDTKNYPCNVKGEKIEFIYGGNCLIVGFKGLTLLAFDTKDALEKLSLFTLTPIYELKKALP